MELKGYDAWKTGGDPHDTTVDMVCVNPQCDEYGDPKHIAVHVEHGHGSLVNDEDGRCGECEWALSDENRGIVHVDTPDGRAVVDLDDDRIVALVNGDLIRCIEVAGGVYAGMTAYADARRTARANAIDSALAESRRRKDAAAEPAS